jgi:hypothetical protein
MFIPKYLINENINWNDFSRNCKSAGVLKYNTENININWECISMSQDPNIIYILEDNIDKISWKYISCNSCEEVMKFVINHLIYIDMNEFDWGFLSRNRSQGAIDILTMFKDKIEWGLLSGNNFAVDLLKENIDKIRWGLFVLNSSEWAVDMIERNLDSIPWVNNKMLSSNYSPRIIDILRRNPHMIDWYYLSQNPFAAPLLLENLDKINWEALSSNEGDDCLKILEEYPSNIDWRILSENPSPRAIKILENNLDKIEWFYLWYNVGAVHIIEQNIHKLEECEYGWENLSINHNAIHLLAPLDHIYMREQAREFKQELTSYVICPERLSKIHLLYYNDISFIEMLSYINEIYC